MDHTYVEMMKRSRAYMHQEEGIVKEVSNKKALVVTDRQTMCSQCVAKSFCEMLGGGKQMLSEALNPVGAKPGDMVKIGIPSGIVTKASMVVYMIPAIGLVGGAAVGYYAGKSYSVDFNLSTLIGCLAGLGIAMIVVRLLSNVLSKRPSYQPEIIKIINPDDLAYQEEAPINQY